jgi:integrase
MCTFGGMAKRKPKMGSIYLRGQLYHIKYYKNGRPIREATHSGVYADAERLLKKRQGEIVTGKFAGPAIERVTMRQLLAAVETDYELNERSSLPQLTARLDNHLLPAFGHLRAVGFGTHDLNEYCQLRKKQGAKPSTINRELEIVKRAWTLALQNDPPQVTRALHIKMFPERNTRTGFLEAEVYALLQQHLPEYLKALLLIAYHVPSRRGELTNLKFSQLDFGHDEIVLDPGTTKNGEGRRMPMFGPMKECLLMQESIRDKRFPQCPYVFFGDGGGRIVDFRKAWFKAADKAGVPRLLFHDLRRTAARNMRRAGIAENIIMKIAGWKTRAMFDRYDIVDGRDLKETGRKMEQYFRVAQDGAGNDSSTGTMTGTTHSHEAHEQNANIGSKLLN